MLRNTLLNTGSSIVYFFLQWATTVLAVRFASFETAGVYAMAISFTNIFYFLAIFGIRNYQISDVENRYSAGQYAGARLVAALCAALGFLAAALLTRLPPYTFACYLVYMVFKLGEAFTEGYFSVLQKHRRYQTLAGSYLAKAVLSAGLFGAALGLTHDLLTAVIAMTAGYILVIAAMDIPQLVRMGDNTVAFRGCGGILYHCVPLLLISLSVPVMNYITRYAVQQELNQYYVGQYASLSSVIVVMSTLAGAVFVVFIPEVSEWSSRGEWLRIRRLVALSMVLMAAAGVAAVAAGWLLGPIVCPLIFGSEILESIDLLVPLLVTATLLMVKSFFSSMLVPFNRRGLLLAGECCGAILCVFTAIPFTHRWGMQGANLSYLVGILLQIGILGGGTLHIIWKSHNTLEREEL